MPLFRNKPVFVEAIQWDGDAHTANFFIGERYGVDWWYFDTLTSAILVPCGGGNLVGGKGDWIIRDAGGKFDVMRPDVFAATFEPLPMSEQVMRTMAADRTEEFSHQRG